MAEGLSTIGSSAFSDFRIAALQQSLGAKAVRAVWIHYVHCSAPIQKELQERLEQLLRYGTSLDGSNDEYSRLLLSQCRNHGSEQTPPDTRIFYITPRTGTVSPWSSKATSIAHVCGFGNEVERIERGMAVVVALSQPFVADEVPWADVLYDRMTQVSVISAFSHFADHKLTDHKH